MFICPKCGPCSYIKTAQSKGPWTTFHDHNGVVTYTVLDDMVYVEPKTVTCDGCGKRRPNPDLIDSSVS